MPKQNTQTEDSDDSDVIFVRNKTPEVIEIENEDTSLEYILDHMADSQHYLPFPE